MKELLMNPWVNLLAMLLLIFVVIGFAAFLYTRVTHIVRCPHCGKEERLNTDLISYPCSNCGRNMLER